MSRLVIATFALCCALGCADARTIEPPVAYCPVLERDGFRWNGVLGMPGAARPGACVSVYRGTRRVAVGNAGPRGAFALQFVGGGPRLGRSSGNHTLEIAGERFVLEDAEPPEAVIGYEPNSLPLVERPRGVVLFEGELESTSRATTITRAWMYAVDEGVVEELVPPPTLDSPFEARISGGRGHHASVASEHESGGAGGCWWPGGGAGITRCSDEVRARTGCVGESAPCEGLRGCAIIEVEERRSGAPDPEQMRRIEAQDPRPTPPDAGTRDAEPT